MYRKILRVLKYVLPCSAQYPLAYKMGKGRALIVIHPMQMYFLLGLEKFLNFPRGPRSPEVSKGRKLGNSSMGSSRAGASLLADILLQRRASLVGLGTTPRAPCLTGQCI